MTDFQKIRVIGTAVKFTQLKLEEYTFKRIENEAFAESKGSWTAVTLLW